MAGTINFASPNYHESQPFPIEQPLAETVATNPAAAGVALPLLLSYMTQRQGAQADYRDQIEQQHQMALGALQENQANNARERLIDILKNPNPGMLGMAVSNPLTAPLMAGTDPASMKGMNDYANRAAVSKLIESAGRGAQGFLAGGIQPDVGAMSNLTGLPMVPGTPPVVQAAQQNAAGRVAAAQIGANSKDTTVDTYNADNPLPTLSVVTTHGRTNLPHAPQSQTTQQPGGGHITPQTLDAARISNPNAYRDIIAGGGKKDPATGYMVGKSGTKY